MNPDALAQFAMQPQAQQVAPGVPAVNVNVAGLLGEGGKRFVAMHVSSPAGIFMFHLPAEAAVAIADAMKAAASGITLASG